MPTTPRTALSYPSATDAPDFPAQSLVLANQLEDGARDDQGLYADRPVSTSGSPGIKGRYYFATDRNTLFRDMGTGWRAVNGVDLVSSLPLTAPTDHLLRTLVVDMANRVFWTFRYVSTEATYKWVFVGGPPWARTISNSWVYTTTSGSYAALSVPGGAPAVPAFTIQHAGIYEVEYGANIYVYPDAVDSGGALSPQFTIPGPDDPASDNDAVMSHAVGDVDTDVVIMHHHLRRRILRTCAFSAQAINLQGRTVAGGTGSFRGISLVVRPVQLAGL